MLARAGGARPLFALAISAGAMTCATSLAWCQSTVMGTPRSLASKMGARTTKPTGVVTEFAALRGGRGIGSASLIIAATASAATALVRGMDRRRRHLNRGATTRRAAPGGFSLKSLFSERRGFIKRRPYPEGMEEVGDSLWFEVTLEKPLGFRLADGPDGPGRGVGIAEIGGGSSGELLERVCAEGAAPGNYLQEGDELQEVNGQSINGDQDTAVGMIMQAEGPVTLTFSRSSKGSITIAFPNGSIVTAPRQALLKQIAEKAGYDSGCTCKNGRCGKCWHEDPATGELYMLPINCPGIVPSIFRKRQEADRGAEADFESWVPLRLKPCPERFKRFMATDGKSEE
mmetsp:Transcript_72922/g.183775  ORF Transcript_72922/g.183775 Transcript_72922/m.183775 type:complete len:344 (-) Transcript_72922:58-1089(-)